jgi:hypothetical protein
MMVNGGRQSTDYTDFTDWLGMVTKTEDDLNEEGRKAGTDLMATKERSSTSSPQARSTKKNPPCALCTANDQKFVFLTQFSAGMSSDRSLTRSVRSTMPAAL